MPIRFRCAYCKQLMGISRRKSGSVVRCPRCAAEVIVPAMQDAPVANGGAPLHPLLESEDFGRDLAVEPIVDAPPLFSGPPSEYQPHGDVELESFADGSASPDVRRRGIFIPRAAVWIGAVLALFGLAMTFVLGFLLGRATVP